MRQRSSVGPGVHLNAAVAGFSAKLLKENEDKLKQQMAENERMMAEMTKSWEQKLNEAKSRTGFDAVRLCF